MIDRVLITSVLLTIMYGCITSQLEMQYRLRIDKSAPCIDGTEIRSILGGCEVLGSPSVDIFLRSIPRLYGGEAGRA